MASIFVCGDIINKFNNGQFIDEPLRKIIQDCDFAIGNFEGCVKSTGERKGVYQLPSSINSLKESGFDLMLLANNHITDYGREVCIETIKAIQDVGMKTVGAGLTYDETYTPYTTCIGETNFCFINICEAQVGHYKSADQSFGYAWIGDKEVVTRIKNAKKKNDYVIVCVHAGLEHYELPLLQFRELYKSYCDAGADCVIGSHPHISQGMEMYNSSLIFYSLGNFFFPRTFDANSSDIENKSYSLVLKFGVNGISFTPVFHKVQNCRVMLDTTSEAMPRFERLCEDIAGEDYRDKEIKQVNDAYHRVIYGLLRVSLNSCSFNDSFKTKIHNIFTYLFSRNNTALQLRNDKIFLRLIENETYRYVIEEYLKNNINKLEKNGNS